MTSVTKRGRPAHPDVLTPAEWDIVNAVRHGMSNRMIARGRGISLDAVKFHVENAIGKLGLENRDALRHWRGAPYDSALSTREAAMTSTNLELGELGQIARRVRDVAVAEAWYRDVLGLKHLYTFPSAIGDLCFFDCGGTRLMIEKDRDEPGEQNVLYFRVPDINAAFEELKGRGVGFADAPHMIAKMPDGTEEWMAFFKDCDGQLLGIMSQVKP
jgi:DNA-binding CsgD family transcriptional regulator/catechol 2,3-dioxygenase-like lactoylglutathione lyase family enzyme